MQRITPSTAALLALPPLLWAGNAVVGRMVNDVAPPALLNLLRWMLAFVLLLPWIHPLLSPRAALWPHWRRYAVLGLLGVGCYNSLQYLALQTSTPLNVTLVAASTPVWMLGIGALFFGQRLRLSHLLGAVLSLAGVALVLSRGDWDRLNAIELVAGDLYIVVATIAWAFYSWMISTTREPAEVRGSWALFLGAQMVFGLAWSGLFAGLEQLGQPVVVAWGWGLIAALVFVAVGPSIVAYRAYSAGVSRVGPSVAGFFVNLTPLFAAMLSAAFLGESPRAYHALAFALIVGGIVLSSRQPAKPPPR